MKSEATSKKSEVTSHEYEVRMREVGSPGKEIRSWK